MRRMWCAVLLLIAIAGATWYSTARLHTHFCELEQALKQSVVAYQSGDLPAAVDSLEAFDTILEENRLFLHLFVRRDMLYSLKNANATLIAYMPDETKHDFYAEAQRALVQLEIVQDTLFYNL